MSFEGLHAFTARDDDRDAFVFYLFAYDAGDFSHVGRKGDDYVEVLRFDSESL